MKKTTEITRDEWLAELDRLGVGQTVQGGDAGASVKEIHDATGLGRDTVRRKLSVGVAAGTVAVGFANRTRMDGRTCKTPVYRLVRPAKSPRRKK